MAALVIALMALTAVALGHARGLVVSGGEVVLCVGDKVVTIAAPDGAGHPGQGRTVHCPDMAAGLLAALSTPQPSLPLPAAVWRAVPPAPAPLPQSLPPPAPRARGPPLPVWIA